jgi:hypothetical protein
MEIHNNPFLFSNFRQWNPKIALLYFFILKRYLILNLNSVINLVLHPNIKFMIDDGSSILFWSDIWIESNIALHSIFPGLYKVSAIQNGLFHEMDQ